MKEKSKKEAKEVKLTEAKPETEKEEKLTYEQLEQVAMRLNQQCQQMYEKLQEAERIIKNVNDIELLLSVIRQSEYFDEDFIKRCADKIQTTLTEMLDSAEERKEESK